LKLKRMVESAMSSNTQQPGSIARPPLLAVRIGAWVVFLLSLCGVYELVKLPPDEFMSPGQNAAYTAAVVAMACCSFLVIVVSHAVYYQWDDERITTSFLGWKRSMRWDEVDNIVARLAGDLTVYDLRDVRGQRLKVHIHVGGWKSPLFGLLRDKWASLVKEDLKNIERSDETRFPVRILGLPAGCFIVRDDSVIHKRGPRTREMTFKDVEAIYPRHERGEWPGARGCELVSRTGERMRITPRTTRHDRLVPYVASHAVNAVWVDLDGPEPATPRERAAYLRGKLALIRNRKRAALLSVSAVLSLCLYLAVDLLDAAWLPSAWVFAVLTAALLVGTVVYAIWWFTGGATKTQRKLENRLAAAGSAEESGKHDENNG
jgi:hypothetical protein